MCEAWAYVLLSTPQVNRLHIFVNSSRNIGCTATFFMKIVVNSRLYNLTETPYALCFSCNNSGEGRVTISLWPYSKCPVVTSPIHMVGIGSRVRSCKNSSQKVLASPQYAEKLMLKIPKFQLRNMILINFPCKEKMQITYYHDSAWLNTNINIEFIEGKIFWEKFNSKYASRYLNAVTVCYKWLNVGCLNI